MFASRYVTFPKASCDDVAGDISVNVREPEVTAHVGIGQACVVQTQQMQHGGVQVVDVHPVGDRLEPEVVGRPVGQSAAGAAAGVGAGAAAILASAGSLALLIFARLNRSLGEATDPSDMTHITLICPRCGKKQAVSLGEADCSKCGLRIHTAIE